MWPFSYNNLWSISVKAEKTIPGAQMDVAQVPLGKPYNGAYAAAVSYDSHNPEAAYWLVKYIGSYQGQLAYALGGGNPCRQDVVLDPRFQQRKYHPIAGAFRQSHIDNIAWADRVLELGHFTSTAMGKIYPELMHASYAIRSNQNETEKILHQLKQTILELQNRHGEVAAIE
jgi:multiple sugar transport system substrate-binding protein